ncbi:MAG: hypothetical protein ACI8P3_001101 [Saprospiraceae bacterium]|jgi:hypothetical protein
MNFIGELLAQIFVDIIFNGLIRGIYRLIKNGYGWIKRKIWAFSDMR